MKRKISYEQNEALARGRDIARSNQRRRVAANAAADKAAAERQTQQDVEQAREREQRGGFDLGQRVTGRDRTFGSTRTGTVIAGEKSEQGQGVWIETDNGYEIVLAYSSVSAVSA